MSAIESMVSVLKQPTAFYRAQAPLTRGDHKSHAKAMLALIGSHDVETSSRELAAFAGVPVTQVLGILKHSIAIGRVSYRVDEHRIGQYRLVDNFDEVLREELFAAARFLRKHGWSVTPPTAATGDRT